MTTRWKGTPLPLNLSDTREGVKQAKKARDGVVEFEWKLTGDDLVGLRSYAYHWGSRVSGRFRGFHARVTDAITRALGDPETPYRLHSKHEGDYSVACTSENGHYRLHGHAPASNIIGYAEGALHEQKRDHGHLTPACRVIILAALKELGLDIESLSSTANRAVLNTLYGMPPGYGLGDDVPTAVPTGERQILFHGPFGVSGRDNVRNLFDDELSDKGGVYLWTLETNRGEYVHYVGQTARGFAKRQAEHIEKILSGQYNTYDPDALAKGEIQRVSPSETWWPRSLPTFLDTYVDATPKRTAYIQKLRFYLAPLQNQGEHLLDRLEGAVGRHFLRNADPLIVKFLGAGFKVPAAVPGAVTTRFLIEVAGGRSIVGMPDHLIG